MDILLKEGSYKEINQAIDITSMYLYDGEKNKFYQPEVHQYGTSSWTTGDAGDVYNGNQTPDNNIFRWQVTKNYVYNNSGIIYSIAFKNPEDFTNITKKYNNEPIGYKFHQYRNLTDKFVQNFGFLYPLEVVSSGSLTAKWKYNLKGGLIIDSKVQGTIQQHGTGKKGEAPITFSYTGASITFHWSPTTEYSIISNNFNTYNLTSQQAYSWLTNSYSMTQNPKTQSYNITSLAYWDYKDPGGAFYAHTGWERVLYPLTANMTINYTEILKLYINSRGYGVDNCKITFGNLEENVYSTSDPDQPSHSGIVYYFYDIYYHDYVIPVNITTTDPNASSSSQSIVILDNTKVCSYTSSSSDIQTGVVTLMYFNRRIVHTRFLLRISCTNIANTFDIYYKK